MSARTVTLVSVAGALALATPATATFTGLAVTMQPGTTDVGAVDLDVYRLYATFDSPLDQVVAVGGTLDFPQTLDSGGSGFYQVTGFGAPADLPQVDFFVGFNPDLLLDSFLTIGVPQGYIGTTPNLPNIVLFNLTDFNPPVPPGFGSPVVITPDGGWLTTPDPPETFAKPYPPPNATPDGNGDGVYCTFTLPPGATHGVLIAQLAVAQGSPISGDLGALAVIEDGTGIQLGAPETEFLFAETCILGACCLGPEDCIQGTTAAVCEFLGGIFLGPGSLCQFEVFQVNHEGPPSEWSHTFETIFNCPTEEEGPGCVDGPAKIDVWQTTPMDGGGSSNCENFNAPSACPIPAGFFGTGSDLFGDEPTDIICFVGEPIGVTTIPGFPDPLDFGDADTLVTRPSDPFDRCDLPSLTPAPDIPIQMEQLSLVSATPLEVTYNGGMDSEFWDVRVRVFNSAGQPGGTISVTKEHCNGGTFDSTIAVCPTFIFTKLDPPFTELQIDHCGSCNPAGISMTSLDIPWVHETTGIVDTGNPVCTDFVPAVTDTDQKSSCDCNTNTVRDKCDIEDGTSQDCNLDGIPDECLPPPPCPSDLNDNCQVDFADILIVIAAWGPCPACPEDLDNSMDVGFSDILIIIADWGPCP